MLTQANLINTLGYIYISESVAYAIHYIQNGEQGGGFIRRGNRVAEHRRLTDSPVQRPIADRPLCDFCVGKKQKIMGSVAIIDLSLGITCIGSTNTSYDCYLT